MHLFERAILSLCRRKACRNLIAALKSGLIFLQGARWTPGDFSK